ncbi:hypothetical protein JCM6882_005872 [Rhodosporidiobolus microsporus]
MPSSFPPYSPFAPPPRPSSAGPFSARGDLPSPSSLHISLPPPPALASCSTTPLSSPSVLRPSALATRRETLPGQTRLRARSVGKGAVAPFAHLSPTLAGSPVMQGVDSFAAQQSSPLARTRAEHERSMYGSDESGGEEAFPHSSTEGTEESGSTRSDSPPPSTPRDGELPTFEVVPPSRRGSRAEWDVLKERENWRTGGDEVDDEVHGRHRSKSLEGQTRMSLRRGKSFTSLLVGPPGPSPAGERKEAAVVPPTPIFETYEPPTTPSAGTPSNSDIESGEEHFPTTSLYPPSSDTLPSPAISSTTKRLRDFIPQLTILTTLFLSSFAVILFAIATLPGLFLPHSVSELPTLTAAMTEYRSSSLFAEVHVFAVLTLLFLWKQCFSIPGSVLTNILFGALYGTWMGSAWACLWTATGSTGAYLIAVVIAPLVEYYFATPLAATRRALKLPTPEAAENPAAVAGVTPLSSSDLFSHLMLARLFPLLPYSVLNVISGVLRLPLSPFFLTLLLGSFPFNFATVSIGELVALAAADPSTPLGDKIWSKEVVLKLVAVTLVSVVPVIFKEQLKRLIASSTSSGGGLSSLVERAKNALARALFGFSAVPHAATSTHHAPSASLSSTAGSGSGPRAWRRKLSRSIGGAGEFLQLVAAKGGLSGRKGYERVSSLAAEAGDEGERHELSSGVEEAEMGGVRGNGGGVV